MNTDKKEQQSSLRFSPVYLCSSVANSVQINSTLTEVSSWIDRMASASNFATESDLIRLDFLASFESGIEFVKTTSFKQDASILLTASPESTDRKSTRLNSSH